MQLSAVRRGRVVRSYSYVILSRAVLVRELRCLSRHSAFKVGHQEIVSMRGGFFFGVGDLRAGRAERCAR
jgi:hypothetical protein